MLAWAALIAFALGGGLAGFRHERWPDAPPPASEIAYSMYMTHDGGTKSALDQEHRPQIALYNLPPGVNRPSYAPSRSGRYDSVFMIVEPDGQVKLICHIMTSEGWYGWPWRWAEWRSITNYDVSDPSRPFAPHPGRWKDYRLAGWEMVQLGWAGDDGMRIWGVQIFWPVIVAMLLLTATASALAVGSLRWSYAVRQVRRRRENRCLTCGYSLNMSRLRTPCPECGSEYRP